MKPRKILVVVPNLDIISEILQMNQTSSHEFTIVTSRSQALEKIPAVVEIPQVGNSIPKKVPLFDAVMIFGYDIPTISESENSFTAHNTFLIAEYAKQHKKEHLIVTDLGIFKLSLLDEDSNKMSEIFSNLHKRGVFPKASLQILSVCNPRLIPFKRLTHPSKALPTAIECLMDLMIFV